MTVINLRQACREPWDHPPDFPFEVKSAPGGKVRLKVLNTDKRCAEIYQTFQDVTGEFDAAAWLPIFEAMAAKCREVVGKLPQEERAGLSECPMCRTAVHIEDGACNRCGTWVNVVPCDTDPAKCREVVQGKDDDTAKLPETEPEGGCTFYSRNLLVIGDDAAKWPGAKIAKPGDSVTG